MLFSGVCQAIFIFSLFLMAEPTGLEPAISSVTGWHVRPTTPRLRKYGGQCRTRTYGPLLVRQVLSPTELIARFYHLSAAHLLVYLKYPDL